jgi:hypothetical protein
VNRLWTLTQEPDVVRKQRLILVQFGQELDQLYGAYRDRLHKEGATIGDAERLLEDELRDWGSA